MNPTSLGDVRNFWFSGNHRPSKRLGQNFLVDANIVRIILEAADVNADDTVLEIGPGLGALTQALVEQAGQVVAVEKDRRLYEHLTREFAGAQNLRLISSDALELDYSAILGQDYKVVSNLPYVSGTAMLVNFLQAPCPPGDMVVTLQLEVGERLAAVPGDKSYGLLGLWSDLNYETDIFKIISPTCFWPQPQVKSAVVRMRRRSQPAIDIEDHQFFFEFTKQAFGRRRKQLRTVLRGLTLFSGWSVEQVDQLLAAAEVDPAMRPESLGVQEWGRLANSAALLRRASRPQKA